jgi:hypothetical protein
VLVGDVGLVLGDVVGADAARRELADRARQEAQVGRIDVPAQRRVGAGRGARRGERGEGRARLVGRAMLEHGGRRGQRHRATSSTAAIRSWVPPRHLLHTGIAPRPASIWARNARYFSPRQIAANGVSNALPITNAGPMSGRR